MLPPIEKEHVLGHGFKRHDVRIQREGYQFLVLRVRVVAEAHQGGDKHGLVVRQAGFTVPDDDAVVAFVVVMYQQRGLPFFTRLSNRLTKTWHSRECGDFEWTFRYDPDTQELEIKFFIERVPTAIDLWFGVKEAVYVDRLSYFVDDEFEPMEYGAETFLGDVELRLRITPAQRLPTTKMLMHFRDPIPDVDSRVKVRIEATHQEDLAAANNAHDHAQAGDISSAIEALNQFPGKTPYRYTFFT